MTTLRPFFVTSYDFGVSSLKKVYHIEPIHKRIRCTQSIIKTDAEAIARYPLSLQLFFFLEIGQKAERDGIHIVACLEDVTGATLELITKPFLF